MKTVTKLWIWLAVLIILSPLGLILPEHFRSGAAWGEWSSDEMQKLVGYIPKGLEKLSSLWKAPMPDYALKGWEGKGSPHLSLAYILSAAAGMGITVIIVLALGKILTRKKDR